MIGHVSWTYFAEPTRSTILGNLVKTAGSADYRCAAHQYRSLAAGHYDFALFGKLMPWDHAAGVLLHQEAGGYAAILDGSPYAAHVHSLFIILRARRGELADDPRAHRRVKRAEPNRHWLRDSPGSSPGSSRPPTTALGAVSRASPGRARG